MKSFVRPEDILATLKLEGRAVSGPLTAVHAPASHVMHADAGVAPSSLPFEQRIVKLERAHWRRAESEAAQQAGMELRVALEMPGWWSVWDTSEQALSGTCEASDHVLNDPEHRSLLYLDMRSARQAVVETARHAGLILHLDGAELWAAPLGVLALVVSPLPAVLLDLSDFGPGMEDAWLLDQMRELARDGSTWGAAVAVGMFARLRRLTKARRDEVVRAALHGDRDEIEGRVSSWARTLGPEQLEGLQELAAAEADLLFEAFTVFERALAAENEGWSRDAAVNNLVRLLHRREELASGCRVVETMGIEPVSARTLGALDAVGERVFGAMRPWLEESDELLERVGLYDPLAWWGLP